MRTAILVVSTLLLLATAGMGFLGTSKSFKDAKDIKSVYEPAKAEIAAMAKAGNKEAKEIKELGESTGKMKVGAIVLAVCALLALGLLVMNFLGKGIPQVAIAVIATAVLAVILLPQYDTGSTGGMSARTFGYVVAVLGGLGAASAYGQKTLKEQS